jgi:hypothetical protein
MAGRANKFIKIGLQKFYFYIVIVHKSHMSSVSEVTDNR